MTKPSFEDEAESIIRLCENWYQNDGVRSDVRSSVISALMSAEKRGVEKERERTDVEGKKLDEYLSNVGGCGDGNCIIHRPKGMHTNGGCRCSTIRLKMARTIYAYKNFATAIRTPEGEQ